MNEKIQKVAELLKQAQRADCILLKLDPDKALQRDVRIVPGKKYAKIDVGRESDKYGWSGRLMVEIETGNVYGIKAYGVVHKGHYYGTVDTVTVEKLQRYCA